MFGGGPRGPQRVPPPLPVLVLAGDTPATLHQRIQVVEHTLLPEAIRLFALGKLKVADRQVTILE